MAKEVSRRIWVIGPGEQAYLWDEFRRDGIAAIGWDEIGDLLEIDDRNTMQAKLGELWPSDRPQTNNSKCLWQFSREIAIGDLMVARKGRFGVLGIGEVCGSYRYDGNRQEFCHVVDVDWFHCGDWKMPKESSFNPKTLTDLTPYKGFTQKIFEVAQFIEGDPRVPEVVPVEIKEPSKAAFTVESALDDLFIDEATFRIWLELWQDGQNLILQGPPGTGKTFVAKLLANCLIGEEVPELVRMVQFHPSYGYEDFVQGWKPSASQFVRKNGAFFSFCEKARRDPSRKHVFIIDEINRGNLPKIFGEILMLLESDKRGERNALQLAYQDEGESFFVPENVYVLGMMNTADRSIAVVDYALRRRFRFVDIEPAFGTEEFRDFLKEECPEEIVDRIIDRMTALNRIISADIQLGPGYQIGHSYFCQVKSQGDFGAVVRSQIRPLLREMWFDRLKTADEAAERLLEP